MEVAIAMPIRPPAHQIDSAGEVLFRGALPPRWAVRGQHENDYGIDYEVELFDDSDQDTGQLFKVQLKSSAGFDSDEVALDIRLRDLDYWNSLPLPVLVVLADVTDGRLWCAWSVDLDPHPRRSDQSTKTFRFGDAHRLTTEKISEIERRAVAWREWRHHQVRFPVGVVVVDESNDESASERVRVSLRRSLADTELLDLRAHHSSDLGIEVRIRPHETRFTTPGGPDVVVDAPLAVWWHGADGDLTTLLALALANAGWNREAISLLQSPHGISLLTQPHIAYGVLGVLLNGGAADDALSALEGIVERGPDVAAEFALAAVFERATELQFDLERLRSAAARRFELLTAASESNAASKAAYNLANHLRATNEWGRALDWYDRALTSDPAYEQRGYWHRERANCLYELKKYADAASEFQEATALGDDFPLLPLQYSDALIATGRYADAAQQCSIAATLPDPFGADARLRELACRRAAEFAGPVQNLAEPQYEIQPDVSEPEADLVLDLDATVASAWIAKANFSSTPLKEYIAASVFSFYNPLIVAVAVHQALTTDNESVARDLVRACRKNHGPELLPMFRALSDRTGYQDGLVARVEDMYDDVDPAPEIPIELRFLD